MQNPKRRNNSTAFEAVARGETVVVLNGYLGYKKEGIFIGVSTDFNGINIMVNAKLEIGKLKIGVDNKSYTIVKPVPDFWKGEHIF